MEKYMIATVKTVIIILAGIMALGLVSALTQDKIKRLAIDSASEISTIADFKTNMRDKERRLYCMTKNIYWEAASEPAEGKLAVAQIVMNRVESGKFPGDPCQVIYQKNLVYEKVLCQFSWYCEDTYKMRPVNKPLWEESREAAKLVMLDGFRIPELRDALYYHADYVNPRWNKVKVAKIGRHIFYKDRT